MSTLAVLPIAHPLIFLPSARLAFAISESAGQSLLDLVRASDDGSQPIIGTVPVPPGSATLHPWGTSAQVVRVVRPLTRDRERPFLVTLHGVARIHFPNAKDIPVPSEPHDLMDLAVTHPEGKGVPSKEAVITFKTAAAKLLDAIAQDTSQQSRRDAYVKILNMVEEVSDARAPWMADVIVAGIKADYEDKLEFMSMINPEERLQRATAIFVKQVAIYEVSKRIAQSIDDSLSKQQKEFFLRQQLAAIQRELQSLDRSSPNPNSSPDNSGEKRSGSQSELDEEQTEVEDMADLRQKIEAMEKDSEERKMAAREWKRMKRIPPGSVEHGVVRNYLEWLTAVPWAASAGVDGGSSMERLRDRAFLSKARAQLDEDHFGLEKIKKRLIEYLAILRLKQLQADFEARRQANAVEASGSASTSTAADDSDKQLVVRDANRQAEQASNEAERKRAQKAKAVKGPILLFVGPPGTGKTSLGQSIARALDRPFQRISLGGVRDEAEIRGHRRTYVASGPGAIVQALRKAGRPDPVILLDEIDKVGRNNFHGDPGAALLEVLDPEQNHSFNDHYINVPIDLSKVLFICTSNSLETISAPLLDRCEVVHLSGYTFDEKMHIAQKFLLPKQLQANGLSPEHVSLTQPALLHIATHYTREAGVRSLERSIGAVVRHKAVEWAEHVDGATASGREPSPSEITTYNRVVEEGDLERILGIPRWDEDERHREEQRGLVYGLVVTGMGEGGVLPIETSALPGSGRLKLTGSLGEVIKESGELALSWVKSHAYDLCVTNQRWQDPLKVPDAIDIHLHLPSGAVKKDGPSAGIAMVCAFVSLLTGACVPSDVAMTGEITLRGRVGAVGGIKEKVLGAHRAQIRKVVLPWANRKDVEHDVPPDVRAQMQFVFVRTIEEVLEAAFGKGSLNWRRNLVVMESRL